MRCLWKNSKDAGNRYVHWISEKSNWWAGIYKKINFVKYQKHSGLLNRTMKSYLNGLLINEEVIVKFLNMTYDMVESINKGNAMGLNNEEWHSMMY